MRGYNRHVLDVHFFVAVYVSNYVHLAWLGKEPKANATMAISLLSTHKSSLMHASSNVRLHERARADGSDDMENQHRTVFYSYTR